MSSDPRYIFFIKNRVYRRKNTPGLYCSDMAYIAASGKYTLQGVSIGSETYVFIRSHTPKSSAKMSAYKTTYSDIFCGFLWRKKCPRKKSQPHRISSKSLGWNPQENLMRLKNLGIFWKSIVSDLNKYFFSGMWTVRTLMKKRLANRIVRERSSGSRATSSKQSLPPKSAWTASSSAKWIWKGPGSKLMFILRDFILFMKLQRNNAFAFFRGDSTVQILYM